MTSDREMRPFPSTRPAPVSQMRGGRSVYIGNTKPLLLPPPPPLEKELSISFSSCAHRHHTYIVDTTCVQHTQQQHPDFSCTRVDCTRENHQPPNDQTNDPSSTFTCVAAAPLSLSQPPRMPLPLLLLLVVLCGTIRWSIVSLSLSLSTKVFAEPPSVCVCVNEESVETVRKLALASLFLGRGNNS